MAARSSFSWPEAVESRNKQGHNLLTTPPNSISFSLTPSPNPLSHLSSSLPPAAATELYRNPSQERPSYPHGPHGSTRVCHAAARGHAARGFSHRPARQAPASSSAARHRFRFHPQAVPGIYGPLPLPAPPALLCSSLLFLLPRERVSCPINAVAVTGSRVESSRVGRGAARALGRRRDETPPVRRSAGPGSASGSGLGSCVRRSS